MLHKKSICRIGIFPVPADGFFILSTFHFCFFSFAPDLLSRVLWHYRTYPIRTFPPPWIMLSISLIPTVYTDPLSGSI